MTIDSNTPTLNQTHHDQGLGSTALAEAPLALELIDVSKQFGAVKANQDISLAVKSGSVQGIIGENGAGKSTLMSIIYGLYQPDKGVIRVDNHTVQMRNPQHAISLGIGMVHQHFMLVEPFTALENIMLGAEGGAVLKQPKQQAREHLEQIIARHGLAVPLDIPVAELSVGVQQRIEILKALYRNARILILDEPTGVLTPQEADELFVILRQLTAQGVTVLLITHKLREIMAITDEVSVMRQGKMVAHRKTSETTIAELAELMVGRKVRHHVERTESQVGAERLSVKDLTVRDASGIERVKKVNFYLRAGEIVGVAGVSGNGQSELLQVLAGIIRPTSGEIHYGEHVITPKTPIDAAQVRDWGVAHVPEDRHRMGLVLPFEAYESAILGYQREPKYNKGVLQDRKMMLQEYSVEADKFDIRPRNPALKSSAFSGGNQQKIVIAREINAEPEVLLVGQPTRGVDIGAIEFIHQQMMQLRAAGKAILLVSVELDEIMSLADRIIVMCDGMITGEIKREEANETLLGMLMANASGESV